MKTVSISGSRSRRPKKPSNSYIAEASFRKKCWNDFRLEMSLIGAQLWRLRREEGYTLDYVAKKVRMPKYRLNGIVNGKYIHFGIPDLIRLSQFYGTTVKEIIAVVPI